MPQLFSNTSEHLKSALKHLGKTIQTVASYDNIGNTQQELGDYASALQSHQRALEIRLKTLGENHSDTVASYDNIGNVQQVLEEYNSALQSHQRALEISLKALGENRPDTAGSYNNIGCTQQALGDHTSDLQSHQLALEICCKTLGENHPDTAGCIDVSISKFQRTCLCKFSAWVMFLDVSCTILERCKLNSPIHFET